MKRHELEHVVRASADIADDDEIIVIGSQAILGEHPHAPAALCVSVDAAIDARYLAKEVPVDDARRAKVRAQIERDFAS